MNLDQLRGFETVVRLGTVTRAAEALHLAQPSLSRQLAALEDDLGARLLDRGRRGVVPTEAGRALLPHARRILADADAARRELGDHAGLRAGSVRLGSTPTLAGTLVADAVAAFQAASPGVRLHLSERGSRDLIDLLADGAIDLAVLTAPSAATAASAAGLPSTPLLTEELVVASAADAAPPVADGELEIAELGALPQIAFHAGYELRAQTDAAFRAAGVSPRVVLDGAEMDAALGLVERGVGVAVVPAIALAGRPGIRATRLAGAALTRTISLVTRADRGHRPAAAAMGDAIVAAALDLADAGGALVRADRRLRSGPSES